MSEPSSIGARPEKPELAKYELLEEIGHGGMATVYRALDRRLKREVAVKVIHRHLRESREVATRFAGEARAVAKLRHPNIVEVYDVADEDEPERYLVVELVRGTTLRRILRARTKLPAEIAVAVTLEVAAALEHAHRRGVVHRDVKPENVLVELPSGPASDPAERSASADRALVKITDFGIAKLLDAQGVTSTGQVLGSPAHMAPEQIEGDEVTARADVFALGVLLYESMVGALPFDGKNPAQVLRCVLEGGHRPADRARPTVGSRWSAIIERALARNPADRYGSAAEFAAELKAELAWLGIDKPRRQLASYLAAPEKYWDDYVPRIIELLLERGHAARALRDVTLAASCFNRALAFRPDDPELVGQVTGLAHATRMRRMLWRAAGVVAVAATAAAAAYGGWWLLGSLGVSSPKRLRSLGVRGQASSAPAERPMGSQADAGVAAVASGARAGPSSPDRSRSVRRPRVLAAPKVEEETRPVRVYIRGAQGGKLTIDGQPVPWFRKSHSLVVGRSYSFGFVPPNDECCKGSSQAITIPPGDTELVVEGKIGFKDAELSTARIPSGSSVSCGLYGSVPVPGQKRVPMDRGELAINCMVTTPDGKAVTKQVTLEPGKTTLLSWP